MLTLPTSTSPRDTALASPAAIHADAPARVKRRLSFGPVPQPGAAHRPDAARGLPLLAAMPSEALGHVLALLGTEDQETGLRSTSRSMNVAVVAACADPALMELHEAQAAFRATWRRDRDGLGALDAGNARIRQARQALMPAIEAARHRKTCIVTWGCSLRELAATVQAQLDGSPDIASWLQEAHTVLARLGRPAQAAQVLRRCIDLRGRVDAFDFTELSTLAFRAREPERAVQWARKAIAQNSMWPDEEPDVHAPLLARGLLLTTRLRPDPALAREAAAELDDMLQGGSLPLGATRALAALALGDRARCVGDLAALRRLELQEGGHALEIAEIEAVLGDLPAAMQALHEVFLAPDLYVWEQLQDRFLEPLENDDDFRRLLRLMRRDQASLDAIAFEVPQGNGTPAPMVLHLRARA